MSTQRLMGYTVEKHFISHQFTELIFKDMCIVVFTNKRSQAKVSAVLYIYLIGSVYMNNDMANVQYVYTVSQLALRR